MNCRYDQTAYMRFTLAKFTNPNTVYCLLIHVKVLNLCTTNYYIKKESIYTYIKMEKKDLQIFTNSLE